MAISLRLFLTSERVLVRVIVRVLVGSKQQAPEQAPDLKWCFYIGKRTFLRSSWSVELFERYCALICNGDWKWRFRLDLSSKYSGFLFGCLLGCLLVFKKKKDFLFKTQQAPQQAPGPKTLVSHRTSDILAMLQRRLTV